MKNAKFDIFGVDISIYNDGFVDKTIGNRMKETNCISFDEYVEYGMVNHEERENLKRALNNNFSEFFRHTLTFAYLEHQIIPSIIRKNIKNQINEIRIWSAACSGGHEAYSVAILCDEYLKQQQYFKSQNEQLIKQQQYFKSQNEQLIKQQQYFKSQNDQAILQDKDLAILDKSFKIRIFGTDLSEQEIEIAQNGTYQENALKNVAYGRLSKYFNQNSDKFSIIPELKKSIDFSTFDLLNKEFDCPTSSVFGNFDLIFCSNILYYYSQESQYAIIDKLDKSLAKGGYLVVSEAEVKIVEGMELPWNKFRNYKAIKNLPIFRKE